MEKKFKFKIVLLILGLSLSSSLSFSMSQQPLSTTSSDFIPRPVDPSEYEIFLNKNSEIYKLEGNLLVYIATLPKSSGIRILKEDPMSYLDYKDSTGVVKRNSSGFNTSIYLFQIPESVKKNWTSDKINLINKTYGGLFISSVDVSDSLVGEPIAPLKDSSPGSGYLQYYNLEGKPKFNYTKSITKRFGSQLNKIILWDDLKEEVREKSERIYNELHRFADRSKESEYKLLFIEQNLANKYSLAYEKNNIISLFGAFSIAVKATAVRHDFANVPCAEFMSEVLRQAYARSGYDLFEDFNSAKGNKLIWNQTASVVGFSKALAIAGWIPWDGSIYIPPVGALLMNGSGISPGHTYIAAGDNGAWIVDNGAPRGKNLKTVSGKIIGNQFQTGVFFLPPGLLPLKWDR